MSNDPIFTAKLFKAKTWPMPLKVEIRPLHGLFVHQFVRFTVKRAAEDLGLMVQVTTWDTATYIDFSCNWEERQLLLELLREQYGDRPAAKTFFEIVEAAEIEFVNNIELDEA